MTDRSPSRREVTSWLLLGTCAAALPRCTASSDADDGSDGPSGDSAASSVSSTTPSTAGTDSGWGSAGDWAVGGTAAMVAKSAYRDPFADADVTCSLTCSTTEGPCTADTADREDISEGWTGLPMRMLFRVVDPDCVPVEGATVVVWHTQRTGVYSGVTPSGAFCYGDDPDAENHLYFRGSQVSDADGVVAFDSCFPGWYSSRAPHVHFQVLLGGSLYVTGQVVFDDALCEEIYGTHPEYAEFGLPDTTIATDTVVGGEDDPTPYIVATERQDDGALLAWKTLVIRQSLGDDLCAAADGAGGGGQPGGGGPP